ncbi:MAG: hypothetical protein QOK11_1398 [Pseudonocardiales bacterium]|nr:hypothetical protein [Pseudonocardiales bacterium]
MPQRPNGKGRKARERVVDLARGEHECDLLRQQAASDERKRPHRRMVQPMRVINNSQQRSLFGRLGHEAENRQSDQERIRCGPCDESERDAKRLALGLRETVHKVEERRTQLLHRCEREFHLRLDPGRPGDPKPARGLNRVFEQRRFANARFAVHHQHDAAPAAHAR